jgi:hypothetical protein
MTTRPINCAAQQLPFLALTAFVLATDGLIGFYRVALSGPSTLLMMTDLLLALGLVLVWMHADARESGTPFAPYLLVTLAIGVAGPLGYLIHREARRRHASAGSLRAPDAGTSRMLHREAR